MDDLRSSSCTINTRRHSSISFQHCTVTRTHAYKSHHHRYMGNNTYNAISTATKTIISQLPCSVCQCLCPGTEPQRGARPYCGPPTPSALLHHTKHHHHHQPCAPPDQTRRGVDVWLMHEEHQVTIRAVAYLGILQQAALLGQLRPELNMGNATTAAHSYESKGHAIISMVNSSGLIRIQTRNHGE